MANTLREAGRSILGEIPWETHLCLFYETNADLSDGVSPYFNAGLDRRAFCLWATSEPLEEARMALGKNIRNVDQYLANGSIEIVSAKEWYLAGNQFDLKRISDSWQRKLHSALSRGYSGMCASGNAFWLGTKHWKEFCAYEHDLQRAISGQRMSVLCTYPLASSGAADILEVGRAHQFALVIRNGNWEFIEAAKLEVQANPLTRREREVLAWVARGKSAREIGEILHITKRTVDQHVQTATRKLGATNRAQAVAIALRDRFIDVNG